MAWIRQITLSILSPLPGPINEMKVSGHKTVSPSYFYLPLSFSLFYIFYMLKLSGIFLS